MKYAGLIHDDSPHYIDHLAPFCALMGWPLIVCNQAIAETCRQFYPQVELKEVDCFNLNLPPCIVTCQPKPMLQAALGPFRSYTGKVIWLPHGLSDKGWNTPFFEALIGEDLLLIYGQKMRDVLREKKVTIPQFSIGNFRKQFTIQHSSFYDTLIKNRFGDKRFILYAPTWDNEICWQTFHKLIDQIPNLLIKVHPNTEQKYPAQLEQLKAKAEILENFPPIYPLLSRADLYIGDMSSIGYDFLTFNRPLFFLRKNDSTTLMQSGTQITADEISKIKNPSTPNHTKLISYAFDEPKNWIAELQQKVDEWVSAQ